LVDLLISRILGAKDNAELVGGKHVERAIVEKLSELDRKTLAGNDCRKHVLVDVEGAAVEQINGLAVVKWVISVCLKPSR
jgi:hypothetical protein